MSVQVENDDEFMPDLEDFQADVKQAVSVGYYTPDIPVLQRNTHQDVFVYDTMKKGFGDEYIHRQDPIPIGIGWTSINTFRLYRYLTKNQNMDAVVLSCTIPNNMAPVYGEIYRVPTASIPYLDYAHSNGTINKRLKIPIKVKRGDDFAVLPCWMYVGLDSYWSRKLGSELMSCEKLASRAGFPHPYYNFMKKYILS